MAVGPGVPFNKHLGNGLTKTFAFGFTLINAYDLSVTVDGIPVTDYTISGLGVAAGGSITFPTAPADGAVVLLVLVIALQRSTQYQTNGDLLAETVNADFDRLWQALGIVGNTAGRRSVRVPLTETLAELPAASLRANTLLGFDEDGDVKVVDIPTGDLPETPVNRDNVVIASDGQTVITVPFAYSRGNNSLQVIMNGAGLLEIGADYTETTTTTITLTRAASEGDEFTFLGGALLNPASAIGTVSETALAADSTVNGAQLVGTEDGRTVAEALQQVLIDAPSAQFDQDVPVYNPSEAGDNDAANVVVGTSSGTHTKARFLNYNKVTVSGSGLQAGPERADYGGADVMFKVGWPVLASATAGEMDCRLFAFRQVKGDATFWLGNGQIQQGFGAAYEARIDQINDAGTVQHSINVQSCVVDDVTPSYRGYRVNKAVGTGGVGFGVDSEAAGSWTHTFASARQGVDQWLVDPSDASHVFFKFGDVTKYVRGKAGDNTFAFTDPSGNNVASFERSATTYTPTIGATAGSLTTSAVITALYRRSGKRVEGVVELSTANIGTASGALTITTPSTARNAYDPVTGFNANTAQALTGAVIPSTATVRVYLYTGAFPVANGHTISVRFAYEEA